MNLDPKANKDQKHWLNEFSKLFQTKLIKFCGNNKIFKQFKI